MAEEAKIKVSTEGVEEAQQSLEEVGRQAKEVQERQVGGGAAQGRTQRQFDKSPVREGAVANAVSGGLQKFANSQFLQKAQQTIASGGAFSESGAVSGLAQGAVTGGATAAGAALGGPVGAAIAQPIAQTMNSFVERFFSKQQEVEQQAGGAVRGQLGEFARRGIDVSDEQIAQLLDRERARSRRVVDLNRRIARVQDETSNTIEGFLSSSFRRGLDALVG